MAEQLNQFLNKAFDFEEQGYVEEAIQLCEKCIQVFPEYENDIKLEIAKMIYRNGEKNLALSQFLTIYQETENSEIRDLILEAYYGEKEQEYEKNCQENWKRLETYPHFFGNAAPSEIRYYPIYQSQKEILFYDSIEQKFQIIERFKVVMENQNNMVCISSDLLWMEDILLLEKMTRKVDPFMDMENALLLVYHKETWDLLLQIFDLKHLIEFDRIVFYDSKDWLEHSILEEGYRFPKIIGGNLSEEIKDLLKDISNKYKQEFTKYHKEALKYYKENSKEIIKHIKEGNPRILFDTTRFSTALQYHIRDCKEAANRRGLKTELIIEKDRLCTGWSDLFYIKKVVEFKPDIIFMIDHFRHENSIVAVLNELVFVCWVQDPLSSIMDKEIPLKLTNKDFILNHFTTWKDFKEVGYNEKYVIDAPVASNPFLYKPYPLNEEEKKKFSCDICFVCHASDVDGHINRLLQNIPVLHEPIRAVYKGYQAYVYETGNVFYTKKVFKDYIEGALQCHYNVTLVPSLLEDLAEDMYMRFNLAVFRQALVDWILDAGFTNIKLWGNGWTKEEKYKKYAMGPAENGETLSKIYQASKIVVGNNIIITAASRAWETMLSGGFYMSNYIPEEVDWSDIRKIIEVGKDVIMFYNRDDLIEKLHYYLNHEEERQIMIKNGRKAALEKMTYDALIEKMLKELAERLELE